MMVVKDIVEAFHGLADSAYVVVKLVEFEKIGKHQDAKLEIDSVEKDRRGVICIVCSASAGGGEDQ